MLYSKFGIGRKSVFSDLPYFYQDENNKPIADICLKESKRLNKNILNLEEVCDFIIKNNIGFDYVLDEVAYINGVDIDSIAFSVYPSTLYENKLIYDFVIELEEEGKDIFIMHDPKSEISYAMDIIIEECIKTRDIMPLEYIGYLCFNENVSIENASNQLKSSSEYVVNKAKEIINTAISSGKKASQQVIDKLDSTIKNLKNQSVKDPKNVGLFQNLINKTIQIKDHLLAKIKNK